VSERFDLIVAGGTCLTLSGRIEADVGLRGGRIAAIGRLDRGAAAESFDARGLHVLPGVIDTQVHFREPGLEHKEDLATGTAAAAMGGVTAVFEMPNTNPNTDSAAALADKLNRAKGRAWVDHAFFVGATVENAEELGALERLPGCCGVKMFMGSSTGTLLVAADKDVARVLASGTRRVAVHSEDEERLVSRRKMFAGGAEVSQHPAWRDAETAVRATRRLLDLARKAKRRVHVLHVTTEDETLLLAEAKDIATFEITPQHLTLAAPECYQRLGTLAQMNPPIREAAHRDGLWRAITSGAADVIGTDHAPHTLEEKSKPYPQSPSGMPGVQTLIPIMLNHVHEGRLTLERFVDLVCTGPARIYNIAAKGRLVLGYDGDLTIVDLGAKRTIANSWIASRCGWTPYDGMGVTGWPRATIIRGRVVMRDNELIGAPSGAPVRFLETL
jgi:dihydroorotase